MIYIYRFLWLIFYIPILIFELIAFIVFVITCPFILMIRFITIGDIDEIPDNVLHIIILIDNKYKDLLETINKN